MVAIRINGQDSTIRADSLPRFTDLVELVKTMIDPLHIISDIRVDGQEPDEGVWTSSTSSLSTSVVEIHTASIPEFCKERLGQVPALTQACYVQFRDARKAFKYQGSILGNKKLATAVETLQAFFQWYDSIYQILPEDWKKNFTLEEYGQEILETCKTICQQQIYQSWWALGQTLEQELIPKLDRMEDYTREYQKLIPIH